MTIVINLQIGMAECQIIPTDIALFPNLHKFIEIPDAPCCHYLYI